MRYGFQRLVLLGSAGYQRAELPLDDSVSLTGPNNIGKTSLINALQFLLIVDKRRMDFGAHDSDASRRFYFPNNSAYILLEATVPESGTVVLGCVGKGVSHDYEYFAYHGQLNVDDFRLPNGTLVGQVQLKAHLADKEKLVFSYLPSEFAERLYGKGRRRTGDELDFTVFRLEHASDASVFQRVLTRTLKLDKLSSAEVKDYLLRIFHRDLPDATIDFKHEWDKAFAEVNAERAQYQAAVNQLKRIELLEKLHKERLNLRGKLIVYKPLIEQRLGEWQHYYDTTRQHYKNEQQRLDDEQRQLSRRNRELAGQQIKLKQKSDELCNQSRRQAELEQRFALVNSRTVLESRLDEAKRSLEAQITLVSQASRRTLTAIQRDQERNQHELRQLEQELKTLADNLYQRLAAQLTEAELARLNRVLSREVMALGEESFQLDATQLTRYLAEPDGHRFRLPGLEIGLEPLSLQYTQRTKEEIGQRIAELQQQRQDLAAQVETARALDKARARKTELEKNVRAIEQKLTDYDQLGKLQSDAGQRAEEMALIQRQLKDVDNDVANADKNADDLHWQRDAVSQALGKLTGQHRDIEQRRDQRGDDDAQFGYLCQLPYHPWLADPGFELEQLAERLLHYQRDCQNLGNLDRQLHTLLADLHTDGLTKYQYSDGEESEISRIIDFSHQLPQEAEALDKKARSAVVNVTACLRELRDGLRTLKSRMRDFNRLISFRQLSDLKVFKIEPRDETRLVEAIEMMISTAEQVESGETFELFNHAKVLDDKQLDRAKQLLINEGNARRGLQVADLFRLEFVVGRPGADPESFDDLDSAASHGTVLMAKLISGLAMLHLMQDKRHQVQAVCYLDEALSLDARNQKSLIDIAAEFGFTLIFASPAPLTTVRYCVPITYSEGKSHISRKSWQIFEPVEEGLP